MKNILFTLLFFFISCNLYSQDTLLKDRMLSFNEKLNLQAEYAELLVQATCNPIYRKIEDTLGFDFIEQRLYPNGQIYYQYVGENGKITRSKEEFYPNGQLKYSGNDYDSLLYTENYHRIYYNIFGDTMQVERYVKFKDAIFQVKIEYGLFGGRISHIHFYWGNEQLYHEKKSFVVSFFCASDGITYFYKTYENVNYKKYKTLLKTFLKRCSILGKCEHVKINKITFSTPFLENKKTSLFY